MASSHTNCVVLLPIYTVNLSELELLATRKNLDILSNWPQVIVAPLRLQDKIEQALFSGVSGERKYVYLDDSHFVNVVSYSQLLMKKWFYELFITFEYMLLIQTDVVIFRDEITKWTLKGYSYVGAPWIIHNNQDETYEVGNGGFSLRRIPDFLEALDRVFLMKCPKWYLERLGCPEWTHFLMRFLFGFNRWVWPRKLNEDFFWSQLVPSVCKRFKVASSKDGFLFSIESVPSWLHNKVSKQTPFGLHAWEKHLSIDDQRFVIRFISDLNGELT